MRTFPTASSAAALAALLALGSQHPLVRPDDTPAKKAKNRRYEIQVDVP